MHPNHNHQRLTCYALHVASPTSLKGTRLNDHILNAIDEEIARLQEARDLLASGETTAAKPAKTRRTLSPKARRAIADAQRKRWAKARRQKKAAKKESAAS